MRIRRFKRYKDMKIIYNKILPFGRNFYALNFFGILFAKGPCDRVTINHEKIHTAQMKELAYVFFYLFYVLEWVVRLFQYGLSTRAYYNISFEREAYANQTDMNYLSSRRAFSFMPHLSARFRK